MLVHLPCLCCCINFNVFPICFSERTPQTWSYSNWRLANVKCIVMEILRCMRLCMTWSICLFYMLVSRSYTISLYVYAVTMPETGIFGCVVYTFLCIVVKIIYYLSICNSHMHRLDCYMQMGSFLMYLNWSQYMQYAAGLLRFFGNILNYLYNVEISVSLFYL